jgi:hypothetical protein
MFSGESAESGGMALRIGRAIRGGVERTLNPTGLALMVATAGYTLVLAGSVNSVVEASLPPEVREQAEIGLTFPLSPAAAGALAVVSVLFGTALFLGAARTFTRDAHERSSFTADPFTRRIGRALVSAVGANLVVVVAVMVGFVLLVVPGLFLAVSFVFVVFAIAVEDARALEALRRSWELASGNRLRLFALVLVIGVASGLLGGVGSVVAVESPLVGQVVSVVLSTPVTVVGYGVVADAYVQLREGTDGRAA